MGAGGGTWDMVLDCMDGGERLVFFFLLLATDLPFDDMGWDEVS